MNAATAKSVAVRLFAVDPFVAGLGACSGAFTEHWQTSLREPKQCLQQDALPAQQQPPGRDALAAQHEATGLQCGHLGTDFRDTAREESCPQQQNTLGMVSAGTSMAASHTSVFATMPLKRIISHRPEFLYRRSTLPACPNLINTR